MQTFDTCDDHRSIQTLTPMYESIHTNEIAIPIDDLINLTSFGINIFTEKNNVYHMPRWLAATLRALNLLVNLNREYDLATRPIGGYTISRSTFPRNFFKILMKIHYDVIKNLLASEEDQIKIDSLAVICNNEIILNYLTENEILDAGNIKIN